MASLVLALPLFRFPGILTAAGIAGFDCSPDQIQRTSLELKQSSGQGLTHPHVPPRTLLDPMCSPCTLIRTWELQ